MNLYVYVGNDPVNNSDPSGEECVTSNTTTCQKPSESTGDTITEIVVTGYKLPAVTNSPLDPTKDRHDQIERLKANEGEGIQPLLTIDVAVPEFKIAGMTYLAVRKIAAEAGEKASEKFAKDIAKRIEKDLGKNARRAFHDADHLADRTKAELKADAQELYEAAGKSIPEWLK